MTSLLSAELAATCNALGYYDDKSNKYYADSNTLETVKDLIRYLRRDDETHDIRRQLGNTQVLITDLIPLLKNYWEQTDLLDVLLRLLVNLTTPALMLWNEQLPANKTDRNLYLQIEDHLKNYKQAFADEKFWAVLSARISKILEIDHSERGDENGLIIERILILIRNILYVTPDPSAEKRPDNDASVHDQVLWALHQSGMLDIILYITSSSNEKAYYLHTLEILSFMLREQKASELARAALQRSETEKVRDEAELLAIRHRETIQKRDKVKKFNGARHSRFGGTYVLKSMKSISDNELIYHKPLNKLEALNFDADKRRPKTAKNRMPLKSSTFERRSAFTIRLFLKEFSVEFLNGAYNTLMYHVKDNLVRARAQAHDESYYLWALRFFMEFNRCYKFEVKLVSETMSMQTFRYVQQLMEDYFTMMDTDKGKVSLWSRRLHLALLAYRELLLTISLMDKSPDFTVKESARVLKNNLFYVLEYREMILTLLLTYDELKMSNMYLKDLLETQHIFIKMLESFCGSCSVVVQKKTTKKGKKRKKATRDAVPSQPDVNLESQWDEAAPQLSIVLEGITELASDVVPFDAASDIPIDEQKTEAMKNVQRKLRNGEYENAVGLLRASREVWPEDNCFGINNMAPEEEFLALREIFFADLGENDISPVLHEQPVYDEHDEEEDGDEEDGGFAESNFRFEDFSKRLANPKVVRACGLALQDFESNSINTNHCIVKLLHRIAVDCKLYAMVFQVSIFRSFQKIYANKDFPQYRELVKFATYIIRQFIKVSEVNKKVYFESLFFKTATEAYEIEHGYGDLEKKMPKGAWSEEQEDELRRLFMEHQENQLKDDVVDWIVNNLIDNTRTRRGVLKKLKEMCLLTNYKGPRKSGAKARIPRLDRGDGEETQLPELYEQFKDAAEPPAPAGARKRHSKATGRKRPTKSTNQNPNSDNDSDQGGPSRGDDIGSTSDSDSDEEESANVGGYVRQTRLRSQIKNAKKRVQQSFDSENDNEEPPLVTESIKENGNYELISEEVSSQIQNKMKDTTNVLSSASESSDEDEGANVGKNRESPRNKITRISIEPTGSFDSDDEGLTVITNGRNDLVSEEGSSQTQNKVKSAKILNSDSESSDEEGLERRNGEHVKNTKKIVQLTGSSEDEEPQDENEDGTSNDRQEIFTEAESSQTQNKEKTNKNILNSDSESSDQDYQENGIACKTSSDQVSNRIEGSEDEDELRQIDAKRSRVESDDDNVFKPGPKRTRIISSDEEE